MVKDMDIDVKSVYHVKAHRTKARIEQLQGDELKVARGNCAVDLPAKEGAERDVHFGKQWALEELGVKVRWAVQNVG